MSVAFIELIIEKFSGHPCLSHADDMTSPSEWGCHEHHLNASGLCSFKHSEICHTLLPADMEYRPKAVQMESITLLNVAPTGCASLTSIEEKLEDYSYIL